MTPISFRGHSIQFDALITTEFSGSVNIGDWEVRLSFPAGEAK